MGLGPGAYCSPGQSMHRAWTPPRELEDSQGPKLGKSDYTQVRAVISLLDSISKLAERTTAHLIVDHLERRNKLHYGQYGCRKRRSAVVRPPFT